MTRKATSSTSAPSSISSLEDSTISRSANITDRRYNASYWNSPVSSIMIGGSNIGGRHQSLFIDEQNTGVSFEIYSTRILHHIETFYSDVSLVGQAQTNQVQHCQNLYGRMSMIGGRNRRRRRIRIRNRSRTGDEYKLSPRSLLA